MPRESLAQTCAICLDDCDSETKATLDACSHVYCY
jgi:hypothetical protein